MCTIGSEDSGLHSAPERQSGGRSHRQRRTPRHLLVKAR